MTAKHIREYLDLVDGRELLSESMNYGAMFTKYIQLIEKLDPEKVKPETDRCQSAVKFAKTVLRRNDRIVWWLRLVRVSFAYQILSVAGRVWAFTPELVTALEKFLSQACAEAHIPVSQAKSYDGTWRSNYQKWLTHIMGIPADAIQRFVFDYQNPIDLKRELEGYENVWKDNTGKLIDHDDADGSEILVDCGNNFVWLNLNKGSCDKEANAMGHCGNAYGADGDRVLSLRRVVKRGAQRFWMPFLTFILDAHGYLGEMKGRGNDKPAARYHPQIIQLLLCDEIRGIKGGGYQPETNFDVHDLTEEQQNDLFARKPALAPLDWQYKKHGMTEELAKRVVQTFKSRDLKVIGFSPGLRFLRIEEFGEWQDVYLDYGSESAKYYVGQVTGDGDYQDYDVSDSDVKSLFEELPYGTTTKIAHHLIHKYGDQVFNDFLEQEMIDEEDFDPSHDGQVWALLQYMDDEILNSLRSAAETGFRYGAEGEMAQALSAGLRNIPLASESFDLTVEFDNENNTFEYDTKCWLSLGAKDAISLASDNEELENLSNSGKWVSDIEIDNPRDGFSGYDSKSAVEQFFEENPELRPTKADKKAA